MERPLSSSAPSETASPAARALGLGVVAGMRAALAPALLSRHLNRTASEATHPEAGRRLGALAAMASPGASRWLTLAAAGELIVDKLPSTPARILPGPLVGRAVSGALCGAALYAKEGRAKRVGAVMGGVAAVAGAFAFYHARRALTERGLPDPLVAGLEDAAALALGRRALRSSDAA